MNEMRVKAQGNKSHKTRTVQPDMITSNPIQTLAAIVSTCKLDSNTGNGFLTRQPLVRD